MKANLSRRAFLKLGGGALVSLGLQSRGLLDWWARQDQHDSPPALQETPNVLLIVMDTVRAKSLSLYGYERETTTNLERIAQRGACFTRAISTAPWTLPSHASMFTGLWPQEHQADWGYPLDASYPTLAEVFRARGCKTAGFVANLDYCSAQRGLGRGFEHYEDFPRSLGQLMLSSSLGRTLAAADKLRDTLNHHELLNRKNASKITQDFLKWLSNSPSTPFFAFLNYYDAHQPYLPPPPFDRMFGTTNRHGNYVHALNQADREGMWMLSEDQVQVEINAYDGAIANIDHHLGIIIDELEQTGQIEKTLIIITADHGEQLGEHGLFGHVNSLYLQSLHVPLVIIYPQRISRDYRVDEPVSLRDLPATIIDLISLDYQPGFPGNSLRRYWEPGEGINIPQIDPIISELNYNGYSEQDWFPIAKGEMKSIIVENHHIIVNGDGKKELYDIYSDPEESEDLSQTQIGSKLLEHYRAQLETLFHSSSQS